jgi:simple sugar transport system substrate-binding protein
MTTHSRTLARAATLLCAVILAGCQAAEPSGSAPAASAPASAAASQGGAAASVAAPASAATGAGTGFATSGKIVALWWAPITDPFASHWCDGLEAASADYQAVGFTAECQTAVRNYETPAYVDAINAAVAAGYTGLAVIGQDAQGIKAALEAAREKGVECIITNDGGQEAVVTTGCVTYVGDYAYDEGQAMAKCMMDAGAKHIVGNDLGDHGVGASYKRAKGAVDYAIAHGDPNAKMVSVDTTNPETQKSSVIAILSADPAIDGFANINAGQALDQTAGFKELGKLGGAVKLAFADLSPDAVAMIDAGDAQCATSQQPFLQGYLSVEALVLKLKYGSIAGGLTQSLNTGPFVIDKTNIDSYRPLIEKGYI